MQLDQSVSLPEKMSTMIKNLNYMRDLALIDDSEGPQASPKMDEYAVAVNEDTKVLEENLSTDEEEWEPDMAYRDRYRSIEAYPTYLWRTKHPENIASLRIKKRW